MWSRKGWAEDQAKQEGEGVISEASRIDGDEDRNRPASWEIGGSL